MNTPRYEVHNADRYKTLPGGMPSEHDFGFVLDNEKMTPNALTGKPQRSIAFSGTVPECWAWIRRASAS